MKTMIKFPTNIYSGSFSDFKKNQPHVPEWKWWHGQMRAWAWHWRNAHLEAALLGKRVADMRRDYLSLAKTYRTTLLQLRGAK